MVRLQTYVVCTSLLFILDFKSLVALSLDRGETLTKRLAGDLAVLMEYAAANTGSQARLADLDRLRLLQERLRLVEALDALSGDRNDIQKIVQDLQEMVDKHRTKRSFNGNNCSFPPWCGTSGKYDP